MRRWGSPSPKKVWGIPTWLMSECEAEKKSSSVGYVPSPFGRLQSSACLSPTSGSDLSCVLEQELDPRCSLPSSFQVLVVLVTSLEWKRQVAASGDRYWERHCAEPSIAPVSRLPGLEEGDHPYRGFTHIERRTSVPDPRPHFYRIYNLIPRQCDNICPYRTIRNTRPL